jgi:hypothetical protein
MKKFISLLLAAACSCFFLSACANPSDQNPQPTPTPTTTSQAAFDGPITEILDQLINQTIAKKILADEELADIDCYDKPVDADSCQDILGLTPATFAQDIAAAIEAKPEGSWFAHSIVLIQCQSGVDVALLAEQISKGTNPARFGCIKVESIVVGYAGQFVLLCASCQNTCDAVYETFSTLSAMPAVRIDRENDWNGGGMLG